FQNGVVSRRSKVSSGDPNKIREPPGDLQEVAPSMLLVCTGHANETGRVATTRRRRNKDLAHGAPASGAALERSGALRSAPGLPFCPLSWKQIFEPRPGVNECSYHLRGR